MGLSAYLASVDAAIAPNPSPVEVFGLDCGGGGTLAQVFLQRGAEKSSNYVDQTEKNGHCSPGAPGTLLYGNTINGYGAGYPFSVGVSISR